MSRFHLPSVQYAATGLKHFLSAEAMEYHYGKHHKKYIEQTNTLIAGTELAYESLEKIISLADGELLNNAQQAWNHTFFWNCFSLKGFRLQEEMSLATAIDEAFGSFAEFQYLFTHSASKLFGSGWTWLVNTKDGQLKVVNTHNGDTPLRHGQIPLLVCDVWEHAYYIDYRNQREDYLKNFWNFVNWSQVDAIFNDGDITFVGKLMEEEVSLQKSA